MTNPLQSRNSTILGIGGREAKGGGGRRGMRACGNIML